MEVLELPKLAIRVRFPSPAHLSAALAVLLAVAMPGCTPYYGEPPGERVVSAGVGFHRVERGETLWSIAHRYGTSVDELARVNRLSDGSQIEVGQRLAIPSGAVPPPVAAQAPAPQAPAPAVESAPLPAAFGGSDGFIWPVKGRVIAIFGTRWRGKVNKGIDIQAPAGTEVRAARSGRVSFVHEALPGFGKTIILEHSGGFASVYAYVSEILVRPGEGVAQRQVIARVGDTGRTEVPALHFEIRRNQKAQNPLHYLP